MIGATSRGDIVLCFGQETCSASLQDTVPFSNGVQNVGDNPALD